MSNKSCSEVCCRASNGGTENSIFYQEAQRKLLEKGLEEEMLCAYVNNNMRCYNESTEFADTMEDSLEAAYKVRGDTADWSMTLHCPEMHSVSLPEMKDSQQSCNVSYSCPHRR